MSRSRLSASSIVICIVGCALLILTERLLPSGVAGIVTTLAFFVMVLLAGWSGWRSGLTAVGLGLLTAMFLFSPPYYRRIQSNPVELLRLGLFSLLGIGLTLICEALRRARRRIEDRQCRLEAEIVERKQIEDNLRRLASDLRDADRRKDEFLATLAHELRNPLAPIRNGLELLRLVEGNPVLLAQVQEMMQRQFNQLVRLVDDLLDVSRINHGKLQLHLQDLDLATAISSAVESSRAVIEEMRHQLIVELPSAPIFVNADSVRLSQVFMNLLTNAAKYSEPGRRIWVTVQGQADEVLISVRDEGIGLEPEQLPRIFELFSQLEHMAGKSQGGLGIGLSLVKRLTEMQGGRIAVSSEGAGKGSVFTVRLPIVNSQDAPARQRFDEPSKLDEPSELYTARRILVVDDNRDNADSLSLMLRAIGNQTRTAYDGASAVEMTRQFRPELVLLDIGLPVVDGYEVCRRIRKLPEGEEIIVVAQTGWGTTEDRQKTHAAGFNEHLVKPIDSQALMRLLAKL